MKKKMCFAFNIAFGIISSFVFMVGRGDIILPGTVVDHYFTDSFKSTLQVVKIILCIVAAAILVFNSKVSKELKKINKIGNIGSTACIIMNFVYILIRNRLTIYCFYNIVAAILIILPVKEKKNNL